MRRWLKRALPSRQKDIEDISGEESAASQYKGRPRHDGFQPSQPQPFISTFPLTDRTPTPAPHNHTRTDGIAFEGSFNPNSNNQTNFGNHNTIYNNLRSEADLSAARRRIDNAAGAAFDDGDQEATTCVPGTREQLLKDIKVWARDPDGKVGFWLRGMAGTGKSTVARTVAEHLQNEFPVVSFFFRRGDGDRGSPVKFVTTILGQLLESKGLRKFKGVQSNLLDTYESNGLALNKGTLGQWKCFIQEPLIDRKYKTILLVIDALDESSDSMAREDQMFDFLSEEDHFKGLNIRVFVTSRPQGKTENSRMHDLFVLNEIDEEVVEKDIRLFFRIKFGKFNDNYNRDGLFPTDYHIRVLSGRSTPLFIAAMTSYKFITEDEFDPESQFSMLMSQPTGPGFHDDLDNMYFVVIKQAISRSVNVGSKRAPEMKQTNVGRFKDFVGSVITLETALGYEDLSLFLNAEVDVLRRFLRAFGAVLDIPKGAHGVIRVFHQSFPDFLKDRGRIETACKEQRADWNDLWIDQQKSNTGLFTACLEVMQGSKSALGCPGLKENICDLAGPGSRSSSIAPDTLGTKIPLALRYACKYWASHFITGDVDDVEMHQKLLSFFKLHLLHWIEAMSCLGSLSDVIRDLDQVYQTLMSVGSQSSKLCELVADSRRFTRFGKDGIHEAPLQVYMSALLFAPERSIVKRIFGESLATWILGRSQMDYNWSATLHELNGHSGIVMGMKFSPGGQLLAAICDNRELMVWDVTTGAPVWLIDDATSMDVSSSGTLAFGRSNGSILLCHDMDKRNIRTLPGDIREGRVVCLSFSSDGNFLVAIHAWDILMLWELWDTSGDVRSQQLHVPGGLRCAGVGEAAFSPESKAGLFLALTGFATEFASASETRNGIAVWRRRPDSLWEFHHLVPGDDCASQIVFVGTCLVCICGSPKKLMIWDVHLRKCLKEVAPIRKTLGRNRFAHLSGTNCIVAPDTTGFLWLCDLDKWKPNETGRSRSFKIFQDSQDAFNLSVSADGKLLAGAIWKKDDTQGVSLWETHTGERVGYSQIQGGPRSLAPCFSADGKLIAVPHFDATIQLLDCEFLRQQKRSVDGGKQRRHLTGDPAVSLDGRFVAAPTSNHSGTPLTVEVWGTETSEKVTLESRSHGSRFYSPLRLVFSSRAKWLVLATHANLEIWHLDGTSPIRPLKSVNITVEEINALSSSYDRIDATFSGDECLLLFHDSAKARIGVVDLETSEDPIYHDICGSRERDSSSDGARRSCTICSKCQRPDHFSFFCDDYSCYVAEVSGKSPQNQPLDRQLCTCEAIQVSRNLSGEWLFWQGRSFLWLPSRWRGRWQDIHKGRGTFAHKGNSGMFWLRLQDCLYKMLEKQPEDPAMDPVDEYDDMLSTDESDGSGFGG